MKKNIIILTIVFLVNFLFIDIIEAVCPICTVAVCAGVGLSRWLGIDDLISGVWLGGLIVSLVILTINWLNKKEIHFRFQRLVISLLFYLIVILPLYWRGFIGHPFNRIYGIDKLLLGIIFGSIVFITAVWLNSFLKKKNQGRPFFSFQKVVLPILFLIIISLIFYFITKC